MEKIKNRIARAGYPNGQAVMGIRIRKRGEQPKGFLLQGLILYLPNPQRLLIQFLKSEEKINQICFLIKNKILQLTNDG